MSVDSLPTPSSLPSRSRDPSAWFQDVNRLLARRRESRWLIFAFVSALTAASLLLRVRQLSFHYWIDEGISVGISSHPLAQLPSLLRKDGSPPLYYLLLHVWMQVWGRGETSTHVLSLIFAAAAVPVAYWGGSSLFDRRTGSFCAVLAAGLPFLTTYAQETRMYSLLLLLSIVVAVSFIQTFVRRRRRFLPVFVASLTVALYTHNWALFLGLASFGAFLVCVCLTQTPRHSLWRDGALSFASVLVLYAPWLPTLLYQAKHTGAPWALRPDVWSLTQGGYFIVGGRGVAVALLLGAGSGLVALPATAGAERRASVTAVLLAVLGFGTLLTAWLYAKHTPAWAPRYLALIVGPLILLVGLGLVRAGRLGLVVLVLVCCFWVLDPIAVSRDAKSNVASAAKLVRADLGPNALVLSTQPEQVPVLAYYLPRVTRFGTPLGAVPDPRLVDWRDALSRFRRSSVPRVLEPMIRSLRSGERVALVVPVRYVKTPLWMKLIHRSSLSWGLYLKHDPHLRLLKVVSPNSGVSGLPVRISVFVAAATVR